MSTDTEAMAFLHAHGLDIDPKGLVAALREALTAFEVAYCPSDVEGLTAEEAKLAAEGGLDPTPIHEISDPLVQGVVTYAAILHTGLSTRDAAERLGVSDARIRQRIQERTLLGVRAGKSWRVPVFQFLPDGGELHGWGEVCASLPPGVSAVVVERWLTTPNPDLGIGEEEAPISPRQWLMEGRRPEVVVALAAELA